MPGAPQPAFYPITLGRALSLSFSLFRFGWRTFAAIGVIVAIPVALVEAVVQYMTFDAITAWERSIVGNPLAPRPSAQAVVASLPASTLLIIIVGTFVVAPFLAIGGAALVDAIASAVRGEHLSTKRSFSVAVGRLPSLIGLFLILGLGSLGASAIGYTTPLLSSIMAALGIAGGPVALLGLIVFVAVAFLVAFVLIRLAFAMETLIIERLPLMAALRRSWYLLSGSMLRLVGWMIVFAIVVGLIAFVVGIPIAIVAFIVSPPRLTDLTAAAGFGMNFAIITVVAGQVVGVVLQALVMTGAVLLYFDVRFRHGEQVPAPGQPAQTDSSAPY